MPFTVITLKKVPPSLRGDLTKWMQEIATGVYVGNFNSKVRENLWKRVIDNVKEGEATICYSAKNEVGYRFDMVNTSRQCVDMDGIPVVLIPQSDKDIENNSSRHGFSKAYRTHQIHRARSVPGQTQKKAEKEYVVIDIETDGLDPLKSTILELGAVKARGEKLEEFQKLIHYPRAIPPEIEKLTGITKTMLQEQGVPIEEALDELSSFIGNATIIGYNVDFDLSFINHELKTLGRSELTNNRIDLLREVKRKNIFLNNYKLLTVLKDYKIADQVPHRALSDSRLIYELATKLKIF